MGLELFIRKPVLAITLCLLIILLGVSAYTQLPVRQFPLLPDSEVTITTQFPGASPKVMEGFVSMPMQQSLSGLPGLDYISSTNTDGQSVVTLKFHLGTDISAVLPQITNRINALMWQLPQGVTSPEITKVDPNAAASGAILYIAGQSKTLTDEQMTEYLKRTVVPRFESLPGVAEVQLYGKREYAMRIWLDPAKMAAHDVTASEVVNALLAHNLRSTSGTLNSHLVKLDVTTASNLSTPKQFNNIVIRSNDGQYVRIKDIGEAKLGAVDTTTTAFANGEPTVMMGIMARDRADSIATADRVLASLKTLKKHLPSGMQVNLIWDVTQFARASIHEVHLTIFEAALFVFLVVFAFLGSLRTIAVPLITIPLSMLGAAAIMLALGYSLNTLTLLAWVLAIGLVVDDSIVVVENIHRHMELGLSRIKAAFEGVKELRFAIIAMTLSVAIVFTPIGFVPGISGALFKQFAFTMSLVVIVSGILALYVSPMMCTHFLPAEVKEKSLTARLDHLFDRVRHGYKNILTQVLKIRWLVVIVFFALIFGGYRLLTTTPSELAPSENEGVLIGLGLGPSNANLNYLMKYSPAFDEIYQNLPEMSAYGLFNGLALMGKTNVISWVLLKPENERKRSEDEIMVDINNQMKKIPGLFAFALKQPSVPGAMPGQPVKFVIKTTGSYEQLNEQLQRLLVAIKDYPGIVDPSTTFKMDKSQINVNIDRDKAAALGVPVSEIADALGIMMGKPVVNRFGVEGYSYEVIPQLYRQYRMNPHQIGNIFVRSKSAKLVGLNNLITTSETAAPQSLDQFQQLRSATLKAGIAPGYTMGQVLTYLENYVTHKMPNNFAYDFIGQSREFVHSQGALLVAFIFAIALIYLLLAAHFNSFRDPFIVMLSVPLAIAGALFIMFLTGGTLNIYTKIGLIMLVGLISKHGILMIDFANKLQEKGLEIRQAIIDAAAIRLRPILMTTAAMVFGALPLVLSHGAGSVARIQIGWVIIGGMSLGTCLTLFVVPTAYTFFATRIKHHQLATPSGHG